MFIFMKAAESPLIQAPGKTLEGNYGRITAGQVESAINADDVHKARTRLVTLENTSIGWWWKLLQFPLILKLLKKYAFKIILSSTWMVRIFNAIIANQRQPSGIRENLRQHFSLFE